MGRNGPSVTSYSYADYLRTLQASRYVTSQKPDSISMVEMKTWLCKGCVKTKSKRI